MRSLSCKDLGCGGDYVALGETDQEVIDMMMKYLKKNHSEMLKDPRALEQRMRRNIHRAPDSEGQKFGRREQGIETDGDD